jgi:probable phosphoglycerate mutase
MGDLARIEPNIREWDYGEYEGRTTQEIRGEVPDWTVWTHGAPNGESAAQITRRVDRVIERAAANNGAAVLFAHGHILRALGARWIGLEVSDGARLRLETATLSILGYERENRVLSTWNA